MAAMVGWRRKTERTEMETFDGPGMALLPWPKHLLTVLWEHLRVLVQVIYCTFVSVVQMLRFEVHLTIADRTGQHIQHMSSTANQTESFLLSTLFDGNSSIVVGGSAPLGDPFGGTTEALLTSLGADELCDLVVRATGKDQSSWNMGFPGEWNIIVASSDCSGSSTASKERASEEEWGSPWSSEEDHGVVEFDSEESKALWESLSRSSDPYNPLFFSACISNSTGQSQSEPRGGEEAAQGLAEPDPKVLITRSDSDISWSSSEGSGVDVDTELLDFFQSSDPYNPMCFTACLTTAPKVAPVELDTEEESSISTLSNEERDDDDEEDALWKSLGFMDDPFHPLNFQAHRHSSPERKAQPAEGTAVPVQEVKKKKKLRKTPQHDPGKILVHWKKPRSPPEKEEGKKTKEKKVRFAPEVQVHVMRSWLFARQASRKGQWEELARDRSRFQRRIQQAEQDLGPYLDSAHREKMRRYVERHLGLAP